VIELNEAFASQGIAVLRELGIADDAPHVNPNGGAIALGHPLGMSGARITGTAALELHERARRAKLALATMCIGVGQGIAVALCSGPPSHPRAPKIVSRAHPREGDMEYRLLGRSGLKVSALTVGTATFGHDGVWGTTELAEARRQIDLCLDHGVNLLDTANMYGGSRSEQISGEVLAENGRRQRMMVATKVRFPMGRGPNEQGLSRFHIIEQCEASLRRLKTDVIDLYQVHEWDGSTPLEETMEALDTLIKQGKVRYIGCSNYSAWHLMKALAVSEKHNYQRFVSQQIHYTLEAREAEFELVPLGLDQGVGMLVWSPLAGGWLSGKYTRTAEPDSGRQSAGFREPPIYNWDRLWDIVDVINEVAKPRMACPARRSGLAWLLQRPTWPRSSSAAAPPSSSRTT
jgi:aryl-alcohol dehydrogenase-like predicted oxidoreductase